METALVGLKTNPVDTGVVVEAGGALLSAPTPIVLPPKLNAVMGAEGLNPPSVGVELDPEVGRGASLCEIAWGA